MLFGIIMTLNILISKDFKLTIDFFFRIAFVDDIVDICDQCRYWESGIKEHSHIADKSSSHLSTERHMACHSVQQITFWEFILAPK